MSLNRNGEEHGPGPRVSRVGAAAPQYPSPTALHRFTFAASFQLFEKTPHASNLLDPGIQLHQLSFGDPLPSLGNRC